MSGLLTQIVRRQTLMMTQRRHDSSLLLAGPPINKVSNKVRQLKTNKYEENLSFICL